MKRCDGPEIMEDPSLPGEVMKVVLRDLTRTHRWLGNHRALVKAIARDAEPVRRVLDLGCGNGDLLVRIRTRTGAEVLGVELHPPEATSVRIVEADAVRDPLPQADIAVAVCLVHHLTENEFVELIQNVGRSCRRFIILDLVRHGLPLWLFRTFVGPWIHPVNMADGQLSIRRSFTPDEMFALVKDAAGVGARIRHQVAPLYTRQIVDIRY
ncbi:MAG: methyltransferase domain-containing protein [Bryobacteraceae bacterium]